MSQKELLSWGGWLLISCRLFFPIDREPRSKCCGSVREYTTDSSEPVPNSKASLPWTGHMDRLIDHLIVDFFDTVFVFFFIIESMIDNGILLLLLHQK